MHLKQQWWSGLVAAVLVGLVGVTAVAAAGAQFLPVLSVREGALRSLGIPHANGFIDYVTLLNERDGGINGVPLVWEECETVYDVPRGVECYERLKAKGPTGAAVFPLSQHPARLCPDWSGPRTTRSPCSRWALGARTPRMGGCFRMSSPPRSTAGVRTRPRSGSSANGLAAWRSSRA